MSSPGLANPETRSALGPRFSDLYVCCEGPPLTCVHAVTRVNDTDKAGHKVYTHSLDNSWLHPLSKMVSWDCGVPRYANVPVEARKLLFYLDQLFTCTSWDKGKV